MWAVQMIAESPYPNSAIGNGRRPSGRPVRSHERTAVRCTWPPCSPPARSRIPLKGTGMPMLRTNPDSRRPVLLIRPVPGPPPGPLSLSPDSPVRTLGRPDCLGLEAISWLELSHACGPAGEIPELMAGLTREHGNWSGNRSPLAGSRDFNNDGRSPAMRSMMVSIPFSPRGRDHPSLSPTIRVFFRSKKPTSQPDLWGPLE